VKAIERTRLYQAAVYSLLLASSVLLADTPYPGQASGRELFAIQLKVDALFEQGDYGRALFIYRHELAPLGDKYAQYMIGYMYLAGRGVDKDIATAAAWYRLAAERGEASYLGESRKLDASLDGEQQRRAAQLFSELRAELGDAALIAALIESDLAALGGTAHTSSFTQSTAERRTGDRGRWSREQIESRIRTRLEYLGNMLLGSEYATAEEISRLRDLERRTERELRESRRNP
jgi:hypothetical protein